MKIITITFLFFIHQFSVAQVLDESEIYYKLFRSSEDITKLGTESVALAAEAVWGASELNGNTLTLTGTLTQTAPNSSTWTYASSPTNKLILIYYQGPTIEFTFSNFQGYLNGTWEDFVDSHSINFDVFINGTLNLNIQSQATPSGNTVNFVKQISGDVVIYDENSSVNLAHTGSKYSLVDYNYAEYQYTEQCTGTAVSAAMSITSNESYSCHLINYNNQYTIEKYIANNSSADVGGTNYKFQNAEVHWIAGTQFADSATAGFYNQILEPNNWYAQGTALKNNQHYGNVEFSGPILANTYGPMLVLTTINTVQYVLHPVLSWWYNPTEVIDQTPNISNFILEQNYPNPFNPTTFIRYSIPAPLQGEGTGMRLVILKIFDVLGNEIATLVNDFLNPGIYEVEFNGSNYASGTYFYRLRVGDFMDTKKFLLLK